MQSLGQHLKADDTLSGVEVNYGVKNPVPDSDSIDVRYGGSPVFDMDDGDRGEAELWLDVWKKLDSADAETGHETGIAYAQIYDLANRVLTSVRGWWRATDAVAGASFRLGVQHINADGDAFRDSQIAASRIILIINWQDIGG